MKFAQLGHAAYTRGARSSLACARARRKAVFIPAHLRLFHGRERSASFPTKSRSTNRRGTRSTSVLPRTRTATVAPSLGVGASASSAGHQGSWGVNFAHTKTGASCVTGLVRRSVIRRLRCGAGGIASGLELADVRTVLPDTRTPACSTVLPSVSSHTSDRGPAGILRDR